MHDNVLLGAGTSIQWGAWTGVGMTADSAVLTRIARSGLGVIPPSKGLQILQSLMTGSEIPPVVSLPLKSFD